MRLESKHFVYLTIIVYSILLGLFWINGIDAEGIGSLIILFVVASLISFILFQIFILVFRRSLSFWVSPILKIAAKLILLDGTVDAKEIRKVKKFLSTELGEGMAINRFNYFKKLLKNEELEIDETIVLLRDNSTGAERIRMIQFLVGIALSDRFLSIDEEDFIEKITTSIGLPKSTLVMIYELRNFVSERDKQRYNGKKTTTYYLDKAYKILELEPSASFDEVKESYRSLAKIFHPDVSNKREISKGTAKAQFQVIAEAYEMIKKEKGN